MRTFACGLLVIVGGCGDEAQHRVDADVADSGGEIDAEPDTSDTSDSDTTEELTPETVNSWPLLVASYDRLETVAGKGAQRDEGNEWLARYERGPAIAAELSRPHMAMADVAGHIFIADKEAHAVRRVDPDGRIFTAAGTGEPGDDGDAPGPATERRLTDPNGLYVIDDGTTWAVHILDAGSGKVRRLAADGTLTTFIIVPGGIDSGRGLWVADDESHAFVAAANRVLRWDAVTGVSVYASDFVDCGNLVVDPQGALVVTDRGGNRVYRVSPDGTKTPIAGNGQINNTGGGGEGEPALASGLQEPRAVWFLGPDIGGYFVGTHEGNQVWYVDPAGILHLFLDGGDGHAHSGDGQYFRTPGQKVSEVRAITIAPNGDILVTENDYGYVRRVLKRR